MRFLPSGLQPSLSAPEVVMDNNGRLYSQVAAEAGVTSEQAMVACYLANLANEGRTLDQAATLLRKERHEARAVARDWSIRFTDYVTAPKPLALTWEKAKRGRWELSIGGELIAEAVSDGHGGYDAKRGADAPFGGSKAEVAIRRLSADLERRSVEIFGVDDVVIFIKLADGVERMAPKLADNPKRLAEALAA
jgi:hypothetical protein